VIIPTIELEISLWNQGYPHVAGVDEAGKGPLAGPVTAGAVIIHNKDQLVNMVRDSKLMSAKQREKAYNEIIEKSSGWGVGIVSAEEIDSLGIDYAVKKAMLMALEQAEKMLQKPLSYVIVDGSKTKPLEKYHAKRILKGGLYHYSIAAGSILAKVTRDKLMMEYAQQFPLFGFDKHVGYGTKDHMLAIKKHGPCPIHRKSFAPMRSLSS
jgi:ribonuclease HII